MTTHQETAQRVVAEALRAMPAPGDLAPQDACEAIRRFHNEDLIASLAAFISAGRPAAFAQICSQKLSHADSNREGVLGAVAAHFGMEGDAAGAAKTVDLAVSESLAGPEFLMRAFVTGCKLGDLAHVQRVWALAPPGAPISAEACGSAATLAAMVGDMATLAWIKTLAPLSDRDHFQVVKALGENGDCASFLSEASALSEEQRLHPGALLLTYAAGSKREAEQKVRGLVEGYGAQNAQDAGKALIAAARANNAAVVGRLLPYADPLFTDTLFIPALCQTGGAIHTLNAFQAAAAGGAQEAFEVLMSSAKCKQPQIDSALLLACVAAAPKNQPPVNHSSEQLLSAAALARALLPKASVGALADALKIMTAPLTAPPRMDPLMSAEVELLRDSLKEELLGRPSQGVRGLMDRLMGKRATPASAKPGLGPAKR